MPNGLTALICSIFIVSYFFISTTPKFLVRYDPACKGKRENDPNVLQYARVVRRKKSPLALVFVFTAVWGLALLLTGG